MRVGVEWMKGGGRYCGLGGFHCGNALKNLFRLLRIHRHRKSLEFLGATKAAPMGLEPLWITAIFTRFDNFDEPIAIADILHWELS